MGDILLSEGVMERLGYNAQALLDQARSISGVYDMDEDEAPPGVCSVLAYAAATSIHPEPTPEEKELQPGKEQRCFPDIDDTQDREEARALEWGIIEGKLDEAANLGCSSEFRAKLAELLSEYRDVFRIKLGQDPPVDMSPFKVTLKPDAVPVRCKARHYAPEDRAFMKKHVQELIDAGLCYRNPHSKWCSPPLIIKKVEPVDFRITVDFRRLNAQTLRMIWPMPILEVVMDYLTDSELYFLLDFFKGYWHFLLSLECQELFSFLTDMGIFTPTRVLMGGSDSVAYCQAPVQEMFEEFLYNGLLIWLDGLIGYAKSEEGLLKLLWGVLKVCATIGLGIEPIQVLVLPQRSPMVRTRGVEEWCSPRPWPDLSPSGLKRSGDRSRSPAVRVCTRVDEDVHSWSQQAHSATR
ncbi:hypothetical protein PF008_g16908 [Phytophthora fragariae]|uniref:Reverse transcriptase domain-containing protein n=1 Tax=Phytophthora fragariae TaxID=53985 RepID=A0A6G0RB63_9STRA|nr:hypothetical protein PF008_g16908 [Phytophthora fragariae]